MRDFSDENSEGWEGFRTRSDLKRRNSLASLGCRPHKKTLPIMKNGKSDAGHSRSWGSALSDDVQIIVSSRAYVFFVRKNNAWDRVRDIIVCPRHGLANVWHGSYDLVILLRNRSFQSDTAHRLSPYTC